MDLDISNVSKATVLSALYNGSAPLGLGIIHYRPGDMTIAEAEELLKKTTYFDYVSGRVMKIDLSGDTLRTGLYDRDNGHGAAARILAPLGVRPVGSTVEKVA